MLRHRSVSRVLQKTPQMHEQSRLSGHFDSYLFIIQYFLINKGISVTCDIKKKFYLSCLFNDFGLKCLLRSTDMHEIDYTFLFLLFFSFFPKVIWRGRGMHCTNLVFTLYINIHVRGIFVSCFLKLITNRT